MMPPLCNIFVGLQGAFGILNGAATLTKACLLIVFIFNIIKDLLFLLYFASLALFI
jgi:hypothetical protein